MLPIVPILNHYFEAARLKNENQKVKIGNTGWKNAVNWTISIIKFYVISVGGLVPKKRLPSLRICQVVWRTSITREKLANHSNPFQRNVEWDYFWRYWLAHTLCSSQVIIITEFTFVHHFHEIFSLILAKTPLTLTNLPYLKQCSDGQWKSVNVVVWNQMNQIHKEDV